jgi:hypothetical protein
LAFKSRPSAHARGQNRAEVHRCHYKVLFVGVES